MFWESIETWSKSFQNLDKFPSNRLQNRSEIPNALQMRPKSVFFGFWKISGALGASQNWAKCIKILKKHVKCRGWKQTYFGKRFLRVRDVFWEGFGKRWGAPGNTKCDFFIIWGIQKTSFYFINFWRLVCNSCERPEPQSDCAQRSRNAWRPSWTMSLNSLNDHLVFFENMVQNFLKSYKHPSKIDETTRSNTRSDKNL